MSSEQILEIKNLKVSFFSNKTEIPVIRGIDFAIGKGKIMALVGESGCGKTMTAMSILGLLPHNTSIVSGEVLFDGKEISKYSDRQLQKIRGKEISLIFQEPGLALNPVYTIGNQIGEVVKLHNRSVKNVKKETIRLLNAVRIPNPEQRINAYPHELSGGMQQRALIAMAIAGQPKLIIADEPTTALDVTVQAQILILLKEIVRELNTSVLLITHDLGIVAEVADTAAVMYAGKIVEFGDVYDIFHSPTHPYTKGLLASIPRLDKKQKRLSAIPGNVPDLSLLPAGCAFHPRCGFLVDQCKNKIPELRNIRGNHQVACDVI
jgi:oligopeptide/dipeptide ABC transporter ATP-binding protein